MSQKHADYRFLDEIEPRLRELINSHAAPIEAMPCLRKALREIQSALREYEASFLAEPTWGGPTGGDAA